MAKGFGLHELVGRGRGHGAPEAEARPLRQHAPSSSFAPARYVDETETVVFGELDIFAGH